MRQLKIMKQVTNRDTSSVDKYLNEISKIELLTPEEEVELARRIKQGDRNALEKLVKANLRFVVSVSKQYQNQGLTLADLINEGNVGLIKAAERFDETKGFKFISYAVWWIRQTILQAVAEQARLVRLPQNKIGSLNKISKTASVLEQKYEREPSLHELSEALGIEQEVISEYLRTSNRPVSMDAPVYDDDERSVHETIPNTDTPCPDHHLLNESLNVEISRSLSALSVRESNILRMFYGINLAHPLTLDEISKEMNLTRERVRQLKDKAIKHLRNHVSRNKILKTYLG